MKLVSVDNLIKRIREDLPPYEIYPSDVENFINEEDIVYDTDKIIEKLGDVGLFISMEGAGFSKSDIMRVIKIIETGGLDTK